MESKPDTIKVSANHKEEISANRADLFVTVKGSSLVSGDAAMKKAKECERTRRSIEAGWRSRKKRFTCRESTSRRRAARC
ncbi:MAG: hypothetical protein U0X92_16080 [Anaerolineales bacterium]